MPQLYSRMDDISWLTPSVSDILDQGAAPPGGNGSIREQMLFLQRRLTELETPARVVNVRPTPSYTLFVTKPDMVGEAGKRRPVTINEIKRSLAHIAEENKDWKFGFLPQLQEVAEAVGILLRTDEHHPLSLRRFLVRSTYRDHPSSMAVAVGNTLEQHLLVYDLAEINGLLMVGTEPARHHFINSMLLTLLSLNTPGELRVAIAGQTSDTFRLLVHTPHALGRVLTAPDDMRRLLEGLVREVNRRQEWFAEKGVDNLNDYNEIIKSQGDTRLPRILFLVSSLSDETWQSAQDEWISNVVHILSDGGKAGVHLLLAAHGETDVPEDIANLLPTFVIARSAAGDYTNKLGNFHGSLMRFVDAFIIEKKHDAVIPVELCTISQAEVEKLVDYWRRITEQRTDETKITQISGTTGVTGMLQRPEPSTRTGRTGPLSPTEETGVTVSESQIETLVDSNSQPIKLQQAQALAAYMGWIGIGPLQDILGMSATDAKNILTLLKAMGVIEDNNGTVARFIRLTSLSPKE